jgi:hypothetical protein
MKEKNINKLIEKMLDGEPVDEQWQKARGSTIDKIEARSIPKKEPEKKETYEDWVKKQPKPITIGLRKDKPKK